ncbi:uncharacterized protein METZ01_LOCUS10014 [marine metagenome]|uniref:Uncharacterized protein n=1 Tax=marine metagenome TaxID=408172 RepID=A0A381NRH4_9ZZZZ
MWDSEQNCVTLCSIRISEPLIRQIMQSSISLRFFSPVNAISLLSIFHTIVLRISFSMALQNRLRQTSFRFVHRIQNFDPAE